MVVVFMPAARIILSVLAMRCGSSAGSGVSAVKLGWPIHSLSAEAACISLSSGVYVWLGMRAP